jgi:hypothetical protein
MKSTVRTVSGVICTEAEAGLVKTNGVTMLPHEAVLVASELVRAAQQAEFLAAGQRVFGQGLEVHP